MKTRVLLFLSVLVPYFAAHGFASITTSDTNPASVSATLNKNCLKAYDQFEEELATYLTKANFIGRAHRISMSDWKETSKASDHVIEERTAYFSVATTVPHEFPMTIFPVTVSRKKCLPVQKAANEAACTAYATVAMDGKKAVSYQKAVELGRGGSSIYGSFSLAVSFIESTTDACTYSMSLTGVDTKYLWAKRHLLNGIEPSLVESRIFKGFVAWGTTILPELEN